MSFVFRTMVAAKAITLWMIGSGLMVAMLICIGSRVNRRMPMPAISVPLVSMVQGKLLVMNCAVAQFHLQAHTLQTQIAPRLLNLVCLLQTAVGWR